MPVTVRNDRSLFNAARPAPRRRRAVPPPAATSAPSGTPAPAVPAPPPRRRHTTHGPRGPQVRTLAALMPAHPGDPPSEWPLYTRAALRIRCGLSPTNSMNRILHGVRDGPAAHPGLIQLGLVEEVRLDVDGTAEYDYRITQEGIACLSRHGTDRTPHTPDPTDGTTPSSPSRPDPS